MVKEITAILIVFPFLAATWTCDSFACVIAAHASTSVRASVFTKNMDTEFRLWTEK